MQYTVCAIYTGYRCCYPIDLSLSWELLTQKRPIVLQHSPKSDLYYWKENGHNASIYCKKSIKVYVFVYNRFQKTKSRSLTEVRLIYCICIITDKTKRFPLRFKKCFKLSVLFTTNSFEFRSYQEHYQRPCTVPNTTDWHLVGLSVIYDLTTDL